MAITNNGTKVNIANSLIPFGYTKPTVTDFNDAEYDRELVLTIPRGSVGNANKAATLANILQDVSVGINKQVTDMVTADYVGTNDVQVFAELNRLYSNVTASADSDFLTNVPVDFIAEVKVYIKTV